MQDLHAVTPGNVSAVDLMHAAHRSVASMQVVHQNGGRAVAVGQDMQFLHPGQPAFGRRDPDARGTCAQPWAVTGNKPPGGRVRYRVEFEYQTNTGGET